jgi:iron complex outermembrane receptor protein
MLKKSNLAAAVATIVGSMAAGTASAAVLEEVIITATKRVQSVQEIPMSIQAVSGETIAERGFDSLDQLSATMPSFQVGDGLLTTSVSMRGMGSQPERGFEQSVGMFIDGIYKPRSRQYRAPFMDINRVEVLRGPQAVLFGLNSTAGAVSIITNSTMPGDELTAEVTAGYEFEYEGANLQGVVGGSVGDSVGLRLAAKYRKDDEGYYDNAYNGKDENAPEETVLRGTAVFQPGDVTTITVKADYADFEFDGDNGEEYQTPYVLNSFGLSNGNTERKLDFKRNMDAGGGEFLKPFIDRDSTGVSQEAFNLGVTLEHGFGEHTLTAIAGYSDLDWDYLADWDFGPNLLLTGGIKEEYEQTNIEVRWTSPQGETLEWIVGAYYQDSDLDNQQPNVLGSGYTDPIAALYGLDEMGYNAAGNATTPVVQLEGKMGTDTESYSAFAFGTYHLSETVRLSGGVRWVDTQIDYSRADSPCTSLDENIMPQGIVDALPSAWFCFNAGGYSDDRSSDNWMPEVALEWDATDEIMVYGKVSKSAKSGGFAFSTNLASDANGNPLAEYDDEEALGYELGMKGSFGDWELNATVFRTEFDDLQVNTFDPVTAESYIQNAAEVITQGIELDARWAVTDSLTLSGAYSYLDAEFDDFDPAPCSVDGSVPSSKKVPGECDASGRNTAYAPENAASLAADLVMPMGGSLNLLGGVYLSYSDDYFTDSALGTFLEQESYTQVDARIGIEASDGKWNVSLVGSNLTEEEIINSSIVFFANSASLKSPRTYLLQATYRFF